MPVKEKISHEDLILYEILRNPLLCGEFIENIDKLSYEEEFTFHDYQREMIMDFNTYVSFCTARAIGKTLVISRRITWAMIFNIYPSDYFVYTVPGRAHLEPVFNALVRLFRTNSFLKNFIATNSGVNNSDFTIKLLNQANLLCRIAGQTGSGIAVVGLHSPLEFVDEGGYYPFATFTEFRPTFNKWIQGCQLFVAGVPTGLRENNVLYHCDQEDSAFSKHRVSADQNPKLTREDREQAIIDYGGEESDDFIHLWLGQHGKPVFALFDRSLMEISNYPVVKLELDGLRLTDNIALYMERLSMLPGLPNRDHDCFFGIDLGYTEPSAIFILYSDNYGRIKFHCKIKLSKVSYPIQERIIDYLDTKYSPVFLGMDEGSSGLSVKQHLMEEKEYWSKDYKTRLIPVDFSSIIILGTDSDGKELKSKTKPYATSLLQEWANSHKIIFTSTDLETITELERMTFTRTPSGEIVYRTLTERGGKAGEDHYTAALLSATMAHYIVNDSLTAKKVIKFFQARWIGT